MKETMIRLNKYLSDSGICSRREADRLIEQGSVTVDGLTAVMGQKVSPLSTVKVKGNAVHPTNQKVYLLFHKPRGIICTADKREKKNIIRYLNYPLRLTYAGRLDKDSEGLMLMTNDGNLINTMMRARNGHEKEYLVKVNKPLTKEFLQNMSKGVPILDTITRPCAIEKVDTYTFRIILTQGLNRQIRRMCEYFHYDVVTLKRIRILNLQLGDLPSGKSRPVTENELRVLFQNIQQTPLKNRSSNPWNE